jgi:signal transduction histidine kinase
VLLHDVTAARRRVRALRDFAGVVAHDLRGPLTGLEGWLEILADARARDDTSVADEALERAREATLRMRQVVEDWLTYTVARDAELHPEPVPLERVAREIARTYEGDRRGGAPRFEFDLPHTVCADLVLLRQLIDNLVGNAVKYSEAGETPVIEMRSSDDHEAGWVRVEVVDDGIGIPHGQEQAIFEEFHRGGVEGRSSGTGLGLALTRRIVRRHGGRIAARRNPTRGSTICFTLPAG